MKNEITYKEYIDEVVKDFEKLIMQEGNDKFIHKYLKKIIRDIKVLYLSVSIDKIKDDGYIILNKRLQDKSLFLDYISNEINKLLHDDIIKIKFEKDALVKLRGHVIRTKKNKEYVSLPKEVNVWYLLNYLNINRKEKLKQDLDIIRLKLKGIDYLPGKNIIDESSKIVNEIDNNFIVLKKIRG